MALPRDREEVAPDFVHTPEAALPVIEGDGVRLRVVLGALLGARSPVSTFSETIYADAALAAGARLEVPVGHEERGVYVAEGAVEESGSRFEAGRLLVLRPGAPIVLRAASATRLLVLGGEPMDGPRHMWWNFVSSSAERIAAAADDWRAGRFGQVPGENELIPLPDAPPLPRETVS